MLRLCEVAGLTPTDDEAHCLYQNIVAMLSVQVCLFPTAPLKGFSLREASQCSAISRVLFALPGRRMPRSSMCSVQQ